MYSGRLFKVEMRRAAWLHANAPVGNRDPVYNFLVLLSYWGWWQSDDIMTSLLKKLSISITPPTGYIFSMFSFQILDRIRRQSSCYSWASCEFNTHRRRWLDSSRQLTRVGGVYRALEVSFNEIRYIIYVLLTYLRPMNWNCQVHGRAARKGKSKQ